MTENGPVSDALVDEYRDLVVRRATQHLDAIQAGALKEKVTCPREPFVQRPRVGKTRRKKLCPPRGEKTNVGDPNQKGAARKKGA